MLTFTTAIRVIYQDSQGDYWFGSHAEGAARFDGTSFTYITVADGLHDGQVRTIQEDGRGTIWFGTANGVSSYDGKEVRRHTPEQYLDATPDWTASDSDLWFAAGNNEGVYRYDGTTLWYLPFPTAGALDSEGLHATTGITKGKHGAIWVATYAGVFSFSGSGVTTIDGESLGRLEEAGSLHIRSILADSKGNVWLGNNGIGVLRIEGETTIPFSEDMGLVPLGSTRNGGQRSPAGSLEHVFAIAEDRRGNIWFGDRDTGAWKFDGKSMTNYAIGDDQPTPPIWDIYEDRDGQLLFALDNGTVHRFDGTSFREFPPQ